MAHAGAWRLPRMAAMTREAIIASPLLIGFHRRICQGSRAGDITAGGRLAVLRPNRTDHDVPGTDIARSEGRVNGRVHRNDKRAEKNVLHALGRCLVRTADGPPRRHSLRVTRSNVTGAASHDVRPREVHAWAVERPF